VGDIIGKERMRDAGLTKMCLALIQAATAARSVGTHVVRCVEAAEVKKHIERMQARQQFYMSGQSNQEGGAVQRREPLEIMPYHQTNRYVANPSLDELMGGGGSNSVVSDS
jgi:uridine phosphorylase